MAEKPVKDVVEELLERVIKLENEESSGGDTDLKIYTASSNISSMKNGESAYKEFDLPSYINFDNIYAISAYLSNIYINGDMGNVYITCNSSILGIEDEEIGNYITCTINNDSGETFTSKSSIKLNLIVLYKEE